MRVLHDRYELLEVLGQGTYGTVWRAADRHIHQHVVAVKVLNETHAATESALQRFEAEAAALAALRHPNIVDILDFGRDERGVPFLVMEYLAGRPLRSLVERRHGLLPSRPSLSASFELFLEIASAIGAAHRLPEADGGPIVHRDVKPENVIVVEADGRWSARVIDFGVARLGDAPNETQTGEMVGSSWYMSPEQALGNQSKVGPASDVFALGVLLVELVTAERAPRGASRAWWQVVLEQGAPTARELGRLQNHVPERVWAVVSRALERQPSDRFADGWVFRDALAAALAAAGDTAPRMRGRRLALALSPVVLGVVAAVAVGARLASARKTPAIADAVESAPPPAPAAPAAPAGPDCPRGMVAIPGGSFFMGSDDELALPSEKPAHNVSVDPFCLDELEVTVADYEACAEQGHCKHAGTTNEWEGISARESKVFDPLCNAHDPAGKARHPVNCVTWEMADRFCREAAKRLPKEAEWELAARGNGGRTYPWGNDPPGPGLLNACGTECVAWGLEHGIEEKAMYDADDGFATTAPVGSFPKGASRYGAQDLAGNVWEWVADWYGPYGKEDQRDPKGPAEGTERVIRGGAWLGAYASWVRPSFRFKDAPTKRSYGIGFRCAK